MAVEIQHLSQPINTAAESDYGSDIDDDTWDTALSQTESHRVVPTIKIEDIEEPVIPDDAEPQTHSLRLARLREHLVEAICQVDELQGGRRPKRERSIEIEYDERQRRSFSPVEVEPAERQTTPVPVEPEVKDERSPLQRFRTAPKKPLSVTDIVSPAWCELQYWYSLTKYGRVRRTAAMKQGSKIHKEKEREVHTEVPVEVATKEDRLGLRLWNIIQGLRTLRSTGLTRELEVIGVLDGQVIIGIIDELSYDCPDDELEEKIIAEAQAVKADGAKGTEALPADQRTMNDFFPSTHEDAGILSSQSAWLGTLREQRKTVYLADIKTRKSESLPKGAQMRPTQMQLMLYRRLLNSLAANEVDADIVFQRYDLEPYKPFSDVFIAGMGGIDFSSTPASTHSDEPMAVAPDPLEEILTHNTLGSLWAHMIAEFTKTISVTAVSSSISLLLTAEFRFANDGRVIGTRSFGFDEEVLDRYVQDEMQWWKGEREARGVDIEEAYKCHICEFRDGCTWRASKVEEAITKARMRNARTSSSVRSQI